MACLTMNFKARVTRCLLLVPTPPIYLMFFNYSQARGMAKLLFELRINSHHLVFMLNMPFLTSPEFFIIQ